MGKDEETVGRNKHSFDVSIAAICGVNAAVIFENIVFWIKKNEERKINFYDGDYWTFNSRKAFANQFSYLTERQVETAIKKLISTGLIKTGNYNESKCDRTLWYALTQKGKSILQNAKWI